MRILIAEDDVRLLKSLVHILELNKFCVDGVDNGVDALEYASSGEYDALILDIMMPGLDGIQVLRTLRSRSITTPALFLTARTEVSQRVEGLDAGASYNLVKSTITDEDSEEETVWKYGETEVDITGIQSKLNSLTADSFTDAQAEGKEEIRVVLSLENDYCDTMQIVLYRYDGTNCLCEINGESTALIPAAMWLI